MTAKEIGKKIRTLREQRKLTKNALATLAGVSPTYIHQIEKGEKCPTVEYLDYICQALNISLVDFFTTESDKNINDDFNLLNTKQKQLLLEFIKSLK